MKELLLHPLPAIVLRQLQGKPMDESTVLSAVRGWMPKELHSLRRRGSVFS